MRYNPALDGLRAIAVALVLAFHARLFGGFGGFFGVDVFFVLSGYLITRILAEQHVETGSLRIGTFYVRRLRRLYPALLLLLAVYLAAAPWVFPEHANHLRDAAVAGLYLSDYGFALWRVPWYLQHTWSLSVEEHFYLVWPMVLMVVFRLPRHWWAPAVFLLAVAATLWRWHVALNDDAWYQPYYRFDTRLSGILLGAAAGLWNPSLPKAAAPMGALLLGIAVTQAHVKEMAALTSWMAMAEIGAALLVLGAHHVRALRWTPLVWVGKLSYGIYLWHFPIMYWLRGQDIAGWSSMLIGSGAAALCAAASYYTVERFSRSGRAHTAGTARVDQVGTLGRDAGIR